jgi:HEAT repeat protein
VLDTAANHIEHLALIGNIRYAQQILDAVVGAADEGQPFAESARGALERLRSGQLMKNVVLFIRQAEENELAEVSTFCRTLGRDVIGALAEALASEQTSGTVRRLRDVLLSFGAAGRAYADDLRTSPNPAVRRAAIELLRAFGGADALPQLAVLLEDTEPSVQRDALRAIVQIGTDEAYATLHQALTSGTAGTREAMIHVLASSRDERAGPLLAYILEHTRSRASLESVCVSAIEGLGKVGGAASVVALREVLYRRGWWAPFRAGRLRAAAAHALRVNGSALASETLERAASEGPRRARRAARAALAAPAPPIPPRRAT